MSDAFEQWFRSRPIADQMQWATEADNDSLQDAVVFARHKRDMQKCWDAAVKHALENQHRVLTCIYCGHQYEQGTPPASAQALTDHIAQCPEHPMTKLRDQIDQALVAYEVLREESHTDCMQAMRDILTGDIVVVENE